MHSVSHQSVPSLFGYTNSNIHVSCSEIVNVDLEVTYSKRPATQHPNILSASRAVKGCEGRDGCDGLKARIRAWICRPC
jgi:hypothetical protein